MVSSLMNTKSLSFASSNKDHFLYNDERFLYNDERTQSGSFNNKLHTDCTLFQANSFITSNCLILVPDISHWKRSFLTLNEYQDIWKAQLFLGSCQLCNIFQAGDTYLGSYGWGIWNMLWGLSPFDKGKWLCYLYLVVFYTKIRIDHIELSSKKAIYPKNTHSCLDWWFFSKSQSRQLVLAFSLGICTHL